LLGGLADETDNLAFLRESSLEELTALPGMGRVKALQLRAAVELGSRAERSSRRQTRRLLKRPEDAYALLESEMVSLPREELRVILLDARNRLIRITRISEGGLSSAVIHPRDLFREAVKANAAALILVHNHPSGDATPSPDDLTTTRRMCETGEMMGIRVVDHLILARGGSVSLKQTGLM
jgi:DNA repair protein RadC